jgi:putative MFS transporter
VKRWESFRSLAVWVAAFGYFVDLFDLMLFGVVRVESLKSLGLSDEQVFQSGVTLMNCQMGGVLIGGFLFGILGDRYGRMKSLFWSIALYSIGNLLNGFVQNVEQYMVLRFITGIGLAGELGVGVTLASEAVGRLQRGWATTLIGAIGLSGTLGAVTVAGYFPWRTCYFIGGGMGLCLLLLRFWVHESPMYTKTRNEAPQRPLNAKKIQFGDLKLLLSSSLRVRRFVALIGTALPIWVTIGTFVTFAPEFGRALNLAEPITSPQAMKWSCIGVVAGDILFGVISQWWRSRKKALALALSVLLVSVVGLFTLSEGWSANQYYVYALFMGLATGYWAVFMSATVEQFGTNLRSTVATTVPNLARSAVIPFNVLYQFLTPKMGLLNAAMIVSAIAFAIATWSWMQLRETFDQDLDYIEA